MMILNRAFALLLAGLALAAAGVFAAEAQGLEPRCDGFPPTNHLGAPAGDVVGNVSGWCYGQLFPIVSGASPRPEPAAIKALRVTQGAKQGRFEMIGLREFRYQPARTIKGWDQVVLSLQYVDLSGLVTKPVRLRVTSDEEYLRMRSAGTLGR